MSVTSGNVDTDAILTSLAAMPTTFNNSLTGAVDINAAFTLASGYLVRPPPPGAAPRRTSHPTCRPICLIRTTAVLLPTF